MAEFQKECDEYGCPPVYVQWQKIVKVMMAQTDPKDVKKRQKEVEIGWQELRDENWGEVEEKKKIPLAPIILAMKQKAMHKAKRISEEGKGKWFGKGP